MYHRSNSAITASVERRALLWLAARLPASATPNQMTVLGVGGGFLCLVGYIMSSLDWRWLFPAALGYCLHWFGDSLDGTLARLRQIERPVFGAYLDQTSDILTISMMMLGIGLSPYVRLDIAALLMIAYLALALLTHMRAKVTGTYEIAYSGFGGSEARLIMVGLTIGMMVFGPVSYNTPVGVFSIFDCALTLIAFWGIGMFTIENVRIVRLLAIKDPPVQS